MLLRFCWCYYYYYYYYYYFFFLQKKEEEHAYLFQYGITSGLWEFREELAKFLTVKYGDKVHR